MVVGGFVKKGIRYLQNQNIDIRIRMLFLMEFAALLAVIAGTVVMLMFTSNIAILIPNFALLIFTVLGIYYSYVKKRYEMAVNLIIFGCAFLALPAMYFTAGGNSSGMPIWFIFGVVFSCLMSNGKARIILPGLEIILASVCMYIGYMHKDWVIPLENEDAAFWDMYQSYIIVSIIICFSLMIYLATYDRQREMLEFQSKELIRVMMADALTGVYNRRAYYEEVASYKEEGYKKDLVLVTMDVNGLKKINDTLGHASGDAMIQTAANIIKSAFGDYGKIYRTGGDEFTATLYCSNEIADRLIDILNSTIAKSEEEWAHGMSIAVGVVAWNLECKLSYEEVEKLADSRMYQNKTEYYRKNGIDRRKSK